jgi:hypothetical protein
MYFDRKRLVTVVRPRKTNSFKTKRKDILKSAEFWIDKLELTPLPEEGGMYKEVYRSKIHTDLA